MPTRKWGNDFASRSPDTPAAEAVPGAGTAVDIELGESGLDIRPLPEPAYSLRELVAGITEGNRPGEVDFGPVAGKEAKRSAGT